MAGQNILIMGAGTVIAGKYGTMRILGAGNIQGAIRLTNMRVYGALNADSEVSADTITIAGAANFSNTRANLVKINGSTHFHADANLKHLTVNGSANFDQDLKAVKVTLRGTIHSEGKIEAEAFQSTGAFTVQSLNASQVSIKLHGDCNAEEIGAESVKVRNMKNSGGFFYAIYRIFKGERNYRLEAGTIEADRIYLENTTADAVRGNEVIIGPGCQIKKVEYKTTFQVDSSSSVDVTEQF
jgi:cytoskeletal protein CcmA (bactofilin family)